MNRYVVSAIALLASAGIAVAQSPKGQEGGGAGGAPAAKEASPPAAKSEAPGQMKSGDGSAKSEAPGQMKEKGSSASGDAPGHSKTQDRVDGSGKGSDPGMKSKSSQSSGDRMDGKGSKNADRKDDDKAKSAERDGQSKGKNADRGDADKGSKGASDARDRDGSKQAHDGRTGGKTSAHVDLKPEQRTKVVTTFKSHRVAPARDVHINVNVGTVVPKKVKLYAIPQDIVVIVPAYRSYKYFVFDDRVVIVEPTTYEIIDVLVLA